MNQRSSDDKALSLHIEKLLVSHLDELAEVLLHPEVYEYIEEELPTLDDFKLGLERAIAGPRDRAMAESWLNYLARDASGIMLGRLEATVHHQLAEIAFLFGREHWGRGFASAALLWLHGELEMVHGITEFWATTAPGNRRSQALLLRCGYVETALPASPLFSFALGDMVFRRGAQLF